MANTQKDPAVQKTSKLRYDLSEIRINKTVSELIHMGHDLRDKVPFESLAEFKPVKRCLLYTSDAADE